MLCDRFIDSSIAYQAFGNNLGLNLVANLNKKISENIQPDITFFLDIKVKKSLERMAVFRNKQKDRLENRDEDFYKRVIKGYYYLAKTRKNFFRIDGNGDYNQVLSELIAVFENFYRNKNG